MLPTHVIRARSRLHVVRGTTILVFVDVYRASVVASFAQTASFGSCAPISDVDVLGDRISFQASLCLDRGQQRVCNILANHSTSPSNDSRTCFDIRSGDYATVVDHVVFSASGEV